MKKKRQHKSSPLKWFGVKILYQAFNTGKPNPKLIDRDYDGSLKTYEESILVIRATSVEKAWEQAERIARENEIEYKNLYGQTVRWRFVEIVDTYHIDERKLVSGMEVYSRFIGMPKKLTVKKVMKQLYPDID
ncbi:MAG: DUF4288 domain-containing protein [Bacteroidetes bacterium]|nr:MAG: DUF4288 domain-containing protein [Bacteroidota bacterium]